MGFLSEKDQNEVTKQFAAIEKPVHIIYMSSEEGCMLCKEVGTLLGEVAALSEHIVFEHHRHEDAPELAEKYGFDKFPAFTVTGPERAVTGVRFFGIPSGYEFMSLIEALVHQGARDESGLSASSEELLRGLTSDVHIQVFVTPTCPYCVKAVQLGHRMAKFSDRVTVDMIEATEFSELADRYNVMGVPRIVINEESFFEGALPESLYLEKVMKAVEGQRGNLGR